MGTLCRAFVSLPDHLCERDRPMQERTVFFEVPATVSYRGELWRHLGCLLSLAWGMEKHEKGCTLNPARDCGICGFLCTGGAPLADLLALLPDPKGFVIHHPAEPGEFGYDAYDTPDEEAMRAAVHAVLPKLRELTDDCPACILAALRQRGIPVPVVTDFNWTKEFAAAQSRMNEHRAEQEGRYY